MIIYKITNTITNKVYIGQTKRTLHKRKLQHINNVKKGIKTKLYDNIRKYGLENFVFEVIDSASNIDELNRLETYYIKLYDSVNNRL